MPYTPLSHTQHKHLHLKKGTYFFAKDKSFIPISTVEAPRAGLDLPLGFVRYEKGLSLMAVVSLDKEDNTQISLNGQWMGGYLPVMLRAHPLALVFQENKAVVAVDTDSDWLSETEGRPLFELDGSQSEVLQNLVNLLKTRAPNPNRDAPILQAIEQSGVLVPWPQVSETLLRVDAQKLQEITDEGFLQLRSHNALPVIYAQLMSQPRVNRLKNLAKRKQQMAERQSQQGLEDLGIHFDDNDMIKFD